MQADELRPALMMSVANIFESFTAKAWPYKEGMKLPKALAILDNKCNNGHIDPDLLDVWRVPQSTRKASCQRPRMIAEWRAEWVQLSALQPAGL